MKKAPLPFDPFALAQAAGEAAIGLAARPAELLNVQLEAARQWTRLLDRRDVGKPSEKPRDRRFSVTEWQDDPYYRAIRDAYLLASKQLRETVDKSAGDGSQRRDGAVPARPISERDLAEQFRRDQSRGGEAGQGDRRRQSRPGLPATFWRTSAAARGSSSAAPNRTRSRRAKRSPRRPARSSTRTSCSS